VISRWSGNGIFLPAMKLFFRIPPMEWYPSGIR
jgi:hypothetical protein